LIFVQVEDIVFCEADGAYTAIHLKSAGKIFVSKNLKEYEMLLTDCDFFRVHNSFLINLNEVKRYVKGEGGYVIMSNNLKVDVAKRKKDGFLAKIPKG
jgi:two-component system, LytTR family, response regulator